MIMSYHASCMNNIYLSMAKLHCMYHDIMYVCHMISNIHIYILQDVKARPTILLINNYRLLAHFEFGRVAYIFVPFSLRPVRRSESSGSFLFFLFEVLQKQSKLNKGNIGQGMWQSNPVVPSACINC